MKVSFEVLGDFSNEMLEGKAFILKDLYSFGIYEFHREQLFQDDNNAVSSHFVY